MTTYYVRKTGSDAAAGTSAGAAWATIQKALGASGIASGDTCVIGGGVYREVVNVLMTSATVETFVIGDTDGSQTGDAGEVIWTAYLTDDKTAADFSPVIQLQGCDYLTFERITFVAGAAKCFDGDISAGERPTHITWRDCTFINSSLGSLGVINVLYGTDAAWLFDRCRGFTGYGIVDIALSGSGAGYDANIVFRNCYFLSLQHGIQGGASGGLVVENCTIITGFGSPVEISSGATTTVPCIVRNCLLLAGAEGLYAVTAGNITDEYNYIISASAPVGVTQGTGSIWDGSYALLLSLGQEAAVGSTLRPFMSPLAGSPLLGFGGTAPAVDILNAPRPAGGASALTSVGAFERGNTFARETTTVRTGTNAISIIGPGYHDFPLPVDAAPTTVTVYVRWDATYAGTKPKMQVLNGAECGVADATDTATGSSGAWEQMNLNFTPSAKGIVTIRFLSSDTDGGGKMIVDDYNVS